MQNSETPPVGQVTRAADGSILINGERINRSEWFDNVLALVTDSGEWLVQGVSFTDYLNMIQDDK